MGRVVRRSAPLSYVMPISLQSTVILYTYFYIPLGNHSCLSLDTFQPYICMNLSVLCVLRALRTFVQFNGGWIKITYDKILNMKLSRLLCYLLHWGPKFPRHFISKCPVFLRKRKQISYLNNTTCKVTVLCTVICPGIETQWRWDFPHPYRSVYRISFPVLKWLRRGFNHTPPFSAKVQERIAVYLYPSLDLHDMFEVGN
jgi:hypothetical protein